MIMNHFIPDEMREYEFPNGYSEYESKFEQFEIGDYVKIKRNKLLYIQKKELEKNNIDPNGKFKIDSIIVFEDYEYDENSIHVNNKKINGVLNLYYNDIKFSGIYDFFDLE